MLQAKGIRTHRRGRGVVAQGEHEHIFLTFRGYVSCLRVYRAFSGTQSNRLAELKPKDVTI